MKALGMRMRKLVLVLSLAQVLPEKINKVLSPNNHGFIDVNRTVVDFDYQPQNCSLKLIGISIFDNFATKMTQKLTSQRISIVYSGINKRPIYAPKLSKEAI